MKTKDLRQRCWRKSSYSGAENGDCLEVADTVTGRLPVRDSKLPERVMRVNKEAWTAFTSAIKTGAV
ncbi:DUF397 domain-containing protein [Streptomyces carpaticus]|uniref:DUF397 domain-containing protein n=1 Tax=Streptomyces carpaticus TaxID=285558 RepID=A0ABV4ZRJ0_9ACTN